MSKTLVECVPNFSEGRDVKTMDAIVEAMLSVPGVALLDRESDIDHNRSVVTLAGTREAITESALLGVGKASELIDLTKHKGAHPRLGAADVIPFIPIDGVTLADCVEMAEQVAEQIWKRYSIPTYLYEEAARRPDRKNLENIRKGQFEGLRDEVGTNADRAPDFGEAKLHPTAGATVVGARKFLVAYNINLNTADVSIAKKIAKAVRFSSGGLRFVKGMGVELKARNLAQVSMNLTDFEKTPIARVFEMVKREAARYGASVVGSEIVGLVPKKALEVASEFFLQLEDFDPQVQILENRLASLATGPAGESGGLSSLAEGFIQAVAEPTPAPGGGSAAAQAGATAAALGEMVAAMSAKKKKLAEHADALKTLAARFAELRKRLTEAIDRDSAAFEAVMSAFKTPKESDAEKMKRSKMIEDATRVATEVPLGVARDAGETLDRLAELAPISSAAMASDLETAAALGAACIAGALANVRINLDSLPDDDFKTKTAEETRALQSRIE